MKDKIFRYVKNNKKKIIINLILIIIINLILNFNCILSLFNKTEPITYNSDDLIITETGYEIKDLNKKIGMMILNFDNVPTHLEIDYTSDGFSKYEHINSGYEKNDFSGYELIVYANVAGKVNDIKFDIKEGTIGSIVLNPKISYKLNFPGTFIIFFIIMLIKYLFRNNDKLDLRNNTQLLFVIGVILTFISIAWTFCMLFTKEAYRFGDMYEYLYVNAVTEGRLDLDYKVNDYLLASKNYYDTSDREYDYLWDASFYKGKYYCYFGIWPILSLMAPFHLVTGSYLSTPIMCLIYSILGIIATFVLYNAIINKYFKKISFQTYILSFIFILMGSKLMWCMYRPCFYEIVSLAAYFHVVLGVYLVLFSDKRLFNGIGYSMLALAVLCRPTALFYSLLILPKLWKKFWDKKLKLLDWIILVIPYLVVGLFTMYLNYVRFDSIFEFGISYQLTTNNLNMHSFSILNAMFGLFTYLFGGIDISLFPFRIVNSYNALPIVTDFHIENIGGGVITTSILGFIILFIPKLFKYIKEKELKIGIILALGIAFAIIIFSSGVGALIGRYMLDFNLVFYMVMVILSLYVLKIYHNNSKIKNIYYSLMLISIVINFLITTTNK